MPPPRRSPGHLTAPAISSPPPPGTLGRCFLLVHLIVSPLVFSKETVEVFEYNKVAALVVAAIVLLAGGGWYLARRVFLAAPSDAAEARARLGREVGAVVRDPLALGFGLFFLSAGASTVASISPRISLFGAHESFAGLLTILAYTVLFFGTRALVRSAQDARRVLIGSVIGAAVAGTYALVQLLQLDPIQWSRTASFEGLVRPFGTMGHPNFLAALLAMAFPIAAFFALRAYRLGGRVALAIFAAAGVIACVGVVISYSRGAWLALAAAVLLLLVLWVRAGEKRPAAGAGLLLLFAALALGAIVLFGPGGKAVLESIEERVRKIGDWETRKHIWAVALNVFEKYPVLGCGLDAFQIAFEHERTVAYWLAEWNGTPTKAHNEALHILATQGLVGAGAMLVLSAGVVVAAFRAWRRLSPADRPLLAAVCAGALAFYVQDAFSFTVAGCGTLFVTFAAILSSLARPPEPEPRPLAEPRPHPAFLDSNLAPYSIALVLGCALALGLFFANVGDAPRPHEAARDPTARFLAGLAIVLSFAGTAAAGAAVERAERDAALRELPAALALPKRPPWRRRAGLGTALAVQGAISGGALALIWGGVFRPIQANMHCRRGTALLAYDPEEAVEHLLAATELDPTKELYWVKLGTGAGDATRTARTAAERLRYRTLALDALRRAVALVPQNSYNHANLGRFLGTLARERLARPEQAYAAFDEALRLDRNNAYFYADAANTAINLHDFARARTYAAEGARLYPGFGPVVAQLGYLALLEKRPAEAVDLLRRAVSGSWYGDEGSRVIALANLAAAYLQLGRPEEALAAAREAVELAPTYAESRFNLARALELLGRRDEAIREYRRLIARDPDHAAAREALRTLGVEIEGAPSRPR